MGRRWSGAKDVGAKEYRPSDAGRVVAAMEYYQGPEQGVVLGDLASELSLGGRTLRSILSDLDGVEFVLGYDGERVFVARNVGETRQLSRRLELQASSLMRRVVRREAYVEGWGDGKIP